MQLEFTTYVVSLFSPAYRLAHNSVTPFGPFSLQVQECFGNTTAGWTVYCNNLLSCVHATSSTSQLRITDQAIKLSSPTTSARYLRTNQILSRPLLPLLRPSSLSFFANDDHPNHRRRHQYVSRHPTSNSQCLTFLYRIFPYYSAVVYSLCARRDKARIHSPFTTDSR